MGPMSQLLVAPGAGGGGGSAPIGPPTDTQTVSYGGGYVGLSWANGDPDAHTEIGMTQSTAPCDEADYVATVAPLTTFYATGDTLPCNFIGDNPTPLDLIGPRWWVRHNKNGQVTDWVVVATGIMTCPTCP